MVMTSAAVGSVNNTTQRRKKQPWEIDPLTQPKAPTQTAPQPPQTLQQSVESGLQGNMNQSARQVATPQTVTANRVTRQFTQAPQVATPGGATMGFMGDQINQSYQNMLANPQQNPTVRQPQNVNQSWLGGRVEQNLYGQMNQQAQQIQRPETVGIGDVGSALEQQLLGRISGGNQDAISAAQRADYEADAAKRRAQLETDLNRYGLIGGGSAGGAAANLLGEFEGQVGRGLLDIEAEAQRRRDEDLARALGFSQYQSGLGLQNQSMDQAAQLANAQLGQANRAQNLQGLGLAADVNAQDQARQFQNIGNLQQNDLMNAQLGLAQRDQNLNMLGQAEGFAQGRAALQRQNQQDLQNAQALNAQLDFQQQGLDQNQFAQDLSQEQMLANLGLANRGLEQTANITNAQLGMQQQGLNQAATGQAANYLNQQQQLGISQQAQDLADYLGFQGLNLEAQRIGNQNTQFGQDLALRQQAQDLADYATYQGLGLEAQRVGQGQQQINNQNAQFNAQLAQQGSQFDRSLADTQAARQQQNSQFYSGLNQADRQFMDQLGLQRAELFGGTGQEITAADMGYNPNADQLTNFQNLADNFYRRAGRVPNEQELQTLLSGGAINTGGQQTLQARLADQQNQFQQQQANRAYNLDLMGLTGQVTDGSGRPIGQTLAAQQLAQQGSQFDRQFAESQRQFNQGNNLAERQLSQQDRQFYAGLNQADQQFADDLGLRRDIFGEGQRQFNQSNNLAERQMSQQDRQFARQMGLAEDQFGFTQDQAGRANIRDDLATMLSIRDSGYDPANVGQVDANTKTLMSMLMSDIGIDPTISTGTGAGGNPNSTGQTYNDSGSVSPANPLGLNVGGVDQSAIQQVASQQTAVQPPNLPPQTASRPAGPDYSSFPTTVDGIREAMATGRMDRGHVTRMYNMGLIPVSVALEIMG